MHFVLNEKVDGLTVFCFGYDESPVTPYYDRELLDQDFFEFPLWLQVVEQSVQQRVERYTRLPFSHDDLRKYSVLSALCLPAPYLGGARASSTRSSKS